MDEVLRIKKDLEKMVPKSEANKVLELLRALESIPMTIDDLSGTHIGRTVTKIRKFSYSSEVTALCKTLVRKWKKLLTREDSSNKSTTNNNSNNAANANYSNVSVPQVSGGQQPQNQDHSQTASPNSSSNNEKVASKRLAPTQTEVPATSSEVRLKCRQLLTEALKKPLSKELAQEALLEEEILAGRIEECIYQEFKVIDNKYKNRVRSRVANLGDTKNPYLRLSVLRGDLAPEKIAKMTADEMASDELKKEREKYTKEAINDHQMTLTSGTKTSEIKCPACKKFNVTYNQVQTRSADEPMTTFCYCNECGKRWKFC